MTEEEIRNINVESLKDSLPGACFHGEVWVKCPYCGEGTEISYFPPEKNGYFIIKCNCGKLYRSKR